MEGIICFEKVDKLYDKNVILSDINLNINKGEMFGLLGPSGAGKTTILKIITGQQKASAGKVYVMGSLAEKLDYNAYLKMGMLLDNCGLYERLTAFDNLYIFAHIAKVKKEKIFQVLEEVELLESMNKTVATFSKGMKQRLAFARTILHSPELLFLDEPTSGLDPVNAEKIYGLISNLKQKGTTVFLTTHNMEEAYKLCDNIALINAGKIIEYGMPQKICEKYDFTKNIKISLFDGQEAEFKNNCSDAEKIYKLLCSGKVKSIHSSEPNLETVFIHLTGRKLV